MTSVPNGTPVVFLPHSWRNRCGHKIRVSANYAARTKWGTVKAVERTVYLGKLMIRISGPRAEIYETGTTTNRLICVVEFIELWRTMSSLFLLVKEDKGQKHGHV